MLNIGPYTNVPQSVDWLVSHVLEDSGITSIIGAPNAGKTFIAVDIACSVATGAKALGVFKTRQANVLYLATESVRGLSTRISGWSHVHNTPVPEDALLISATGAVNLSSPSDLKEIDAAVTAHNIGLIVVDTWSLANPGMEENSASQVNAVVHHLNTLRNTHGCAFLLVHHSGKNAAAGGRGSSALLGAMDTELATVVGDGPDGHEQRALYCRKQRNDAVWPSGFSYKFTNDEGHLAVGDVSSISLADVKSLGGLPAGA